jgi:hypothetical protein
MALVLSFCWPSEIVAYAALAHEAIIDRAPHRDESCGSAPVSQIEKEYGDSVTYEQDRLARVKTEFG